MSTRIWNILIRLGVVVKGHFVGVSGRHLDTYINKDEIYLMPLSCESFALKWQFRFVAKQK